MLTGKIAAVTGAARGIGRAIAELFATHGATVVLVDLDAVAVSRSTRELGGHTEGVGCDVVRRTMFNGSSTT